MWLDDCINFLFRNHPFSLILLCTKETNIMAFRKGKSFLKSQELKYDTYNFRNQCLIYSKERNVAYTRNYTTICIIKGEKIDQV